MRRWTGACLLLLCVLLSTGCKSEAPFTDAARVAQIGNMHRLGYGTLRWSIDLDVTGGEELKFVEVLGDLIVTLETPSNMLTAVSTVDGRLVWRKVVDKSAIKLFAPFRTASRTLIYDGSRQVTLNSVVCINSENTVYLLSAVDGHQIGTRPLPIAASNAPAVAEEYLIFGGANGTVFAIDLVTGFKKWAYKMPAAVVARPVLIKPSVFVGDALGVYALITAFAYSGEDKPGELRWKGKTFAPIRGAAAYNNQGIFVASEDQSLYSFNRATGRDRDGWPFRTSEPLRMSPIALGNSLYLPLASGSLVSVDPATARKLWSFPSLAKPVLLQDQRLLLSGGNALWMVDNATGKATVEVQVDPLRAVLRLDKNSLLLVSPNGRMQRYDPET
ncbi:MAG: PQQ-binding-like beta-propeller repeat protein [Planctomycetota bacterium]|nr:PQQ-binding-like beta-propeller repeat protein [Planctomycetota bacterium]